MIAESLAHLGCLVADRGDAAGGGGMIAESLAHLGDLVADRATRLEVAA